MNKAGIFFISFAMLWLSGISSMAQTHSVLSSGEWHKLAVTESNIYSITGAYLQNNGISLAGIETEKIRLFGHPGGVLPQPNNVFRYSDPEEIAIWVDDGNDGSFDTNDKIIFWAEGPDKIAYNETDNLVTYENNFYSDTSYYFLNFNQSIGKRIQEVESINGNYPVVDSHTAYFVHELDQTNILSSGREWYGEKFDNNLNQTFETNISNWVGGSQGKITSAVMASSFHPSKFTLNINGVKVGDQNIDSIPNSQYSIKGQENIQVFPFALSSSDGSNLEVNYIFEKQGGLGYLNYFLVQVQQNTSFSGKPLALLIPQKTDDISTLQISNATSSMIVWNTSTFNNVKAIKGSLNNDIWKANIESDTTNWFYAFDPNSEIQSPEYSGRVPNQDLHGITSAELLIISSPEFIAQAKDLGNYKTSIGIQTEVATTTQVYNEFSSGRQDVTSIRDFAKYLYENSGLKQLLLLGKGTYDYKNIMGANLSFVPIYESRNSLEPLKTYGSDDYLTFMEDNEGEWQENIGFDHTMDIGVGRLPVKSEEEARIVIEKIKFYDSKENIGSWKKKVFFIAENGDDNQHQGDAERLSTLVDTTYNSFDPKKIYVDSYPINVYPSGTKAPKVNEAIDQAIKNGTFIINYTGHGNEGQWAKSVIFNTDMIEALNNKFLPLFVTATCEFGRHDDVDKISGGEELVIKENAGAIGMITTSRPVFATSNYTLNLAFYNEVFKKQDGEYKMLGDIFKATKNNSLNGPNNRNFSLLADPSLKLSYPEKSIQLDSLNSFHLQSRDTIKALEKVRFSGTLRNADGTPDNQFSGKVNITVYDSPSVLKTLGNFEAPFEYKERTSALFVGTSNIDKGEFSFEFVVPLDINYKNSNGKISMYAISNNSTDATGASVSILMSGSATNPQKDTTPPQIKLYMEDSTFHDNDLVSSNTLLIADLFDESGINLSKSQVGHLLTYVLDDQEPVTVSDYFEYNPGSYQSGKLMVPIQDIKPGYHTLQFKAYDVYNNFSEEEIGFRVAPDEEAVISELSAYPNPMRNHVIFALKHNLNGDELLITLQVLNRLGDLVYSKETYYSEAPSLINDLEWDGRNATGQKLTEGIYLFKVIVRSSSSGASTARFGKLMIIN